MELAEQVMYKKNKFDFRIKLVDDNQFGLKNESGKWTGMIGELIEKVDKTNATSLQ